MNDLEEEFEKLVQGMRDQIAAKLKSGELTKTEAADLNDMVTDRVSLPRAWNNSGCYSESYGSTYNDDGWYSSSLSC